MQPFSNTLRIWRKSWNKT